MAPKQGSMVERHARGAMACGMADRKQNMNKERERERDLPRLLVAPNNSPPLTRLHLPPSLLPLNSSVDYFTWTNITSL